MVETHKWQVATINKLVGHLCSDLVVTTRCYLSLAVSRTLPDIKLSAVASNFISDKALPRSYFK